MKVLHVQKVKGIGGAERHLLTLLPALRARGLETRLLVLSAGDSNRFIDAARALELDISVRRAMSDFDPSMPFRVAKEIRAFHPDVVHTHLIHADAYGQVAARLMRCPGVSSVHSVHSFYGKEPARSVARIAGRSARRTIAISQHVADHVAAHGLAPADRVRVVPYGIDASEWKLSAGAERTERSSAGGPEGLVVGMASNLIPGKGHEVMLDAFSAVIRDVPEARLLIAGDGSSRAELMRRAAALGLDSSVNFLGYVSNTKAFMGSCDVLVFPTLPSLGEGFGLAALEAMAAGCPVVASRMGPLREIVVDGVTGFLVAPGSADEIVAALLKLAGDEELRTSLGTAGHERAAASFSVEAMADRTLAVYEELVQ